MRPQTAPDLDRLVLPGDDAAQNRLVGARLIGGKIFWSHFYGKIDPAISPSVTLAIIASGVLFSLWKTQGNALRPAH